MVSGNRGVRRPWTWLPALMIVMLLLSGCGIHLYPTYGDAVKAINNDYFKTKVICVSADGSYIIQNEITGEYFLMMDGPNFLELVPIQMSEMVVNPDGFTTEGEEEDSTNSKSESMSVEP